MAINSGDLLLTFRNLAIFMPFLAVNAAAQALPASEKNRVGKKLFQILVTMDMRCYDFT